MYFACSTNALKISGFPARNASRSDAAGRRPRLLCGFNKLLEDIWIFHGHLRKDFAIESDILGLLESDEFAVLDAGEAESGIQSRDPEAAEAALLGAAVAPGIGAGLDDRFLGLGEEVFASPAIAFGGFQDVLVALLGHDAAFYSGHRRKSNNELGIMNHGRNGEKNS